jgi:hypothetical protein
MRQPAHKGSSLPSIVEISQWFRPDTTALRAPGGWDRNGAIAAVGNAMSVTTGAIRDLEFAIRTATGIMANRVYCTYFDHNYLPRGLALYHSLQRHAPGAELWVLCLSEACHRALLALDLPQLVAVRMADFEAANADVAATRPSRSQIEYYFTCSPAWILFVLESNADAAWVTYLDSDLFFFSSPDPIYDEMNDAAFGIVPHRLGQRAPARRWHRGAALVA